MLFDIVWGKFRVASVEYEVHRMIFTLNHENQSDWKRLSQWKKAINVFDMVKPSGLTFKQ